MEQDGPKHMEQDGPKHMEQDGPIGAWDA